MKIGFIGCGNMGKAMIHGMIDSGKCAASDITASVKTEKSAEECRNDLGINVTTDNISVVRSDVYKRQKHGGANIKVMEMMQDIRMNVKDWSDKDEVKAYLSRMLDGDVFDHKGLIYGMGHAVYSLSDPRERIFRGYVEKLSARCV